MADREAACKQAFQTIDQDDSGFIDAVELMAAIKVLFDKDEQGNVMTEADHEMARDHVMKTSDKSGDGKISYDEFRTGVMGFKK